jgi:hypothetical protein
MVTCALMPLFVCVGRPSTVLAGRAQPALAAELAEPLIHPFGFVQEAAAGRRARSVTLAVAAAR